MASGPYCQSGKPGKAGQEWAAIWQLQHEMGLSDDDILLLFDLLPDNVVRRTALLRELQVMQSIRAMQAEA